MRQQRFPSWLGKTWARGHRCQPVAPQSESQLAATPAVSLPPERPLPHDHGRAPNNPAMSTPTPLGPERRVLHVTDERAPCPLPARSLFGERVRFDHAAIDGAIWSAAREPTSAALVEGSARAPVGEVVGVARALAAKLPVVLALFKSISRWPIARPSPPSGPSSCARTATHSSSPRSAAPSPAPPTRPRRRPSPRGSASASGSTESVDNLLAGGDRISGIAKRLGLSLHACETT